MHESISDVTILTIVISTILLMVLGSIIIYFLFAYQRKGHTHQQELIRLQEAFDKALLQSKVEIQEQTLDHIAKELHANISHLVSVININLSTYLLQSGAGSNENIRETKALVKQLMVEIKFLSVTLNTEHIGRAGLLRMLGNELERLKRTGLYDVTFVTTGETYRLQPEKEIILFRLCQEILNNVIKHANATEIRITLLYDETSLLVLIADNGCGFDVEVQRNMASQLGSTGINNIINRSLQIHGNVTIDSALGNGTTVTVHIPT